MIKLNKKQKERYINCLVFANKDLLRKRLSDTNVYVEHINKLKRCFDYHLWSENGYEDMFTKDVFNTIMLGDNND